MRWIFIDKFVEIQKNSYAKAIKNVTLGEDHIHDQYPVYPIMPHSLIIEAMAQTGGILAGYSLDFKKNIFLAKIEQASFSDLARPGDQIILESWIEDLRDEGCKVTASASIGGVRIGEAVLMFVCMNTDKTPDSHGDDFIFSRELLSVLNVAV
ncbi:beta-hydroxyacyl-ACP dehydratase [bacterium]|nr:beta-hydroxyacyl-ACP dehydratase [bacterium]